MACRATGSKDSAPALLCTSITAATVDGALETIQMAKNSGANILELRLDFYHDFEPVQHLHKLMDACTLPYIVTYRPQWEGYGAVA